MLFKLLVLLIVTPLVELYVLYQLAQLTSIWWTIGVVLVTGFVGSLLAHHQGLQTWNAIWASLSAGRMPTREMLDGVLILIAGATLLTPGLLTDAFGLILLIPATRAFCRGWISRRFKARFQFSQFSSSGEFHFDGESEVLDSYVVKPDDPNKRQVGRDD